MNYHGKRFKAVENTPNGESSDSTVFHYCQEEDIIYASYFGGEIQRGHLLGKEDSIGRIQMVYHHINTKGEIRTGKCDSEPYFTEDGKLRLKEVWKWTNGDQSSGISEIEEIL